MAKKEIYFITGNEEKAKYLSELLDIDVPHKKIDLEEIQSMDLEEVVQKKVRAAYAIAQTPVIVDDVAFECAGLGGLPGPFVKFFEQKIGLDGICDLVKNKDRTAVARCGFGYFDGTEEKYFEGSLAGTIPNAPRGENGYGWDAIFEPEGYDGRTRAELNEEEDRETYLRVKPFAQLKEFLISKGY